MTETPVQKLARFMAEYDPAIAARGRRAVARMKKRVPGANLLVYDNYNALVIGFGPSERASDAVLSIALYPQWVRLFFLHGARLPDPGKRLEGTGSQVRSVVLEDDHTLEEPEVDALIVAALKRARVPIDPRARGRLILKSESETQRPRRPG